MVWAMMISQTDLRSSNENGNLAQVMHVESKFVKYGDDTYEVLISEWLLDTGADVHVTTLAEWRRLAQPTVTETKVKLTTASGEDLGAIGTVRI